MNTRRSVLVDAVLVIVTLAVLGVAGAFVWNAVVTPPFFVRTSNGAQMDQTQLAGIVNLDGWYFVVAAIGGLAAGVGLTLLRPHRPVFLVVLLALAGALASWLMLQVGLAIGPPDPGTALAHATTGTHAPVQLRPHASGVEYAWPAGALLGALLVLLLVGPRRHGRRGDAVNGGDQLERSGTPA